MNKKYLFLILAVLITVLIRLPFLPDDINFNNDAERYSENIERPFFSGNFNVQPPGYIGHIYLGKIFYFFTHDPVASQHIINIVVVLLISFTFFILLGLLGFNNLESLIFTVIFSFNNIIFLGSTTGGNRLFFVLSSIILIYFSIKIIEEAKFKSLLLFAFFLGLFMGFRQDISFYFFFLYAYLCFKVKDIKLILLSLLILTVICLTWLIPLLVEYGGVQAYLVAVKNHKSVYDTSVIFTGLKLSPLLNAVRIFIYLFNAFLLVMPFFVFSLITKKFKIQKNLLMILLLAFIPAFVFQLLVHNGNFVHLAAFMTPLFIFCILNFKLINIKRIIFSLLIIFALLFQFFGVKMIKNPDNVYKKVANALWLQYSYDGAKSGKTLRLKDAIENKEQ